MPQAQTVNPIIQLVPLLFIFAIFYFLLIRPQRKQEKTRQNMVNNLSKNDEIVTTGGIHGTVVNVKDRTVIVRIDDNVKMEMEKSSVAYVKKQQQTAEARS